MTVAWLSLERVLSYVVTADIMYKSFNSSTFLSAYFTRQNSISLHFASDLINIVSGIYIIVGLGCYQSGGHGTDEPLGS